MDDFADLFFDVQESAYQYRRAAEEHILQLRRLVQVYDRQAPHESDGRAWVRYMLTRPKT